MTATAHLSASERRRTEVGSLRIKILSRNLVTLPLSVVRSVYCTKAIESSTTQLDYVSPEPPISMMKETPGSLCSSPRGEMVAPDFSTWRHSSCQACPRHPVLVSDSSALRTMAGHLLIVKSTLILWKRAAASIL